MADTNKGRKVYICSTTQPDDLDQAGYEALTWVQIGGAGSIGESGRKDNIVSYDELDTDVLPKGKGITNAGDPVIEVARKDTDAGQIIARAAGTTKTIYAIKIEDNDGASGYTNTIYYNRGIVVGPVRPNGRNESFNLEQYTIGAVQLEIVVDPTPQSVPTNSTLPSVQGSSLHTAAVLTAIEGTWTHGPILSYTYQWQHDTAGNGTFANITGKTSKTYTIEAAQAGNQLRVEVKAVNTAGTAVAFAASLPTGIAINP